MHAWKGLLKSSLKKNDDKSFQKYFKTFKSLAGVPDLKIYSQLVDISLKSKNTATARDLILEMARLKYPVLPQFNSMLKMLIEQKGLDSGITFKDQILLTGVDTSTSTYAILLNQASKSRRMDVASLLLEEMKVRNIPLNIVLIDMLITGYFKVHDIKSALHWFQQISNLQLEPSVVTYTAIIQGYLNNGYFRKADEWFTEMKCTKYKPNVYTYTSLIHAYANVSLEKVDQLWDEMAQFGIQPNVVTYKSYANAHISHREYARAIEIFQRMKDLEGFSDTIWLNNFLSALLKNHRFQEIMTVYQDVKNTKVADIVTYNIVLNSYLKQGNSKGALELYQEMKRRQLSLDTSTFNTLLHGLVKLKDFTNIERIHNDMLQQNVKADAITRNIMTMAHVKTGGVRFALSQLEEVYHSKDSTPQLTINPYNTLLTCSIHDSLSSGIIDDIWKQFQRQKISPDIRTYNIVLRKCLDENQHKSFQQTLQLIRDKQLTPDAVTLNLKLEYGLSRKDTSQIEWIMKEFRRYRIRPTTETWNVMLTGLFNMKKYSEVLKKYHDLCRLKEHLPTLFTYSVVMNAYNRLGQHDMVESIFKRVENEPRLNQDLSPLISIMIDSAGFNSGLEKVKEIWHSVGKYPVTVNNWNTYFEALLRHKDFCSAIEEFKIFLQSGNEPDMKTARTIVLPFLSDGHAQTRELLELFEASRPRLYSTFPDSWKQHLTV
ncbi:TPR-like protein [Basidiobolus meristosporus CBS 931.73]|uniref:TPR-like protein n=1 Tax=Basidiobolus meristosporus CBS 931.73 TaxID=1314790 RepID=A0A1Y1X465_9FUNG|nr:TPR-like protein [Basidiobolus meristosporus CBS 931.73]|eukprot:ORX80599.1 TPR-like protein [Basidiobolus meristosporus CBS 931.73]